MPCKKCGVGVSKEVYSYSMDFFGMPLCIDCQNELVGKSKPKSTPEARRLYEALKDEDIPAEREKSDGWKHIDIAIPSYRINIEVDGKHHNFSKKQALSDLKRTYHSFRKGYVTLRIPNSLVKDEKTLRETAKYIKAFLDVKKKK